MPEKRKWSYNEVIVACALYAVNSPDKLSASNPRVISVAQKLNMSPGTLSMRLRNFEKLDPIAQAQGRKGLSSVAKTDREVWAAFQNDWIKIIEQAEALVGPLRKDT